VATTLFCQIMCVPCAALRLGASCGILGLLQRKETSKRLTEQMMDQCVNISLTPSCSLLLPLLSGLHLRIFVRTCCFPLSRLLCLYWRYSVDLIDCCVSLVPQLTSRCDRSAVSLDTRSVPHSNAHCKWRRSVCSAHCLIQMPICKCSCSNALAFTHQCDTMV
jgi:hypothetical protein